MTFSSDLIAAGSALGPDLVARSSTTLEGSREWSGAFTSFLGLTPADLPKAVAGCWASAFSVAALARQQAASIEPGSFPMPVLIQPALQPDSGGVAELDSDGTVVVHGVEGPPGPLLQGWVGGDTARRSRGGAESKWEGDTLIEMVGVALLDRLADSLREAQRQFGCNRCEWIIDGDLWILQLDASELPKSRPNGIKPAKSANPDLVRIARLAMRTPGMLGEELVIPWALTGLPVASPTDIERQEDALAEAIQLSGELTSQVWGLPPLEAIGAARRCINELLGPNPSEALDQLRHLKPPDPAMAGTMMSLLEAVRAEIVRLGMASDAHAAWYVSTRDVHRFTEGDLPDRMTRVGVGRWEPFVASVVLAAGDLCRGTAAASGIGAGIRSNIEATPTTDQLLERVVITSNQPVPQLASLLWDAAGLVTETGSPAAHLFESARSLGVPAVSGVSISGDSDQVVAVDGYEGLVAVLPLYDDV